jgi:outer membrane protein assembly factor BamD (BamD/ComL family)
MVSIVVLLLLAPGCASLMQNLPAGATARQVQEAERLFRQGNYSDARKAWQQVAREHPSTAAGEQAAYQAARVLVHPKNPSKNYREAGREFEAFLQRYPSGKYADDAAAWLAALENLEQSRVTGLIEQVDALTKKLEQAAADQRKTEVERDAAAKERDALAAEREGLKKHLDGLVNEKDELLKEKAELVRERDGLLRNKAALEKQVEALTKEKERLLAAKAKLEQRLRDVTEVDIKMEKKRKKMQ